MFSAEPATITADRLEYFREEDKYVATGNVKIEKNNTVLTADKIILYNATADAAATGRVVYEDAATYINAEQVEMNLDKNTGKLHNALIMLKDQKGRKVKKEKILYWIRSDELLKMSEDRYYAKSASFTTCIPGTVTLGGSAGMPGEQVFSSEAPDWCFKGNDVDLRVGDKVALRDAAFRLKGLPVMYSPYLRASLMERSTGFLMPYAGNSTTKGIQFSPSFFWAIDENKDATFLADYYSKRGIGRGVEYRYLDFNDRGKWYLYNINDRELKKSFVEVKGEHEQTWGDIKGFLDINYVNRDDYFKEYASKRDVRTQRFLQSAGEVSVPLDNSRLYLLGQYWADLLDSSAHVPQKLPEIGYVVNTRDIGPLLFSMTSSAASFFRTSDPSGQRLDISPVISHAFGDRVHVFQSVSLRETAYRLNNSGVFASSLSRETFEYRVGALSRFVKNYDTMTHIMEPSLSYSYTPETRPVPTFDLVDNADKISTAQFALNNRLTFRNLTLAGRLTQPYDLNPLASVRPLQPTIIDAGISNGPVTLSLNAAHDFNDNKLETLNSALSATVIPKTTFTVGENYARVGKIMQFNTGFSTILTRMWAAEALVWYDAKGAGVRDLSLTGRYTQQCWIMNFILARRPGDTLRPAEYSFMIMFELKGLGGIKTYEFSSQSQQKAS